MIEERGPVGSRVAALVSAGLLSATVALTYLSYSSAFTPVDTITVVSERAGLVMERDAKVKYLGVTVGTVHSLDYDGDAARLTLSVRRNQLEYIPANVTVRIASNTVFGAKSVEFLLPDHPSPQSLPPRTTLHSSEVAVEINTLFESLVNTLHKIDPVNLNATLTAVTEGLRNNGADLGDTIAEATAYLSQINPELPTLQRDAQKLATVADIYSAATPNLLTTLDNTPTLADTIVDKQNDLTETLLAATGVAAAGTAVLDPAEDDLIAAIQRLRAPLKVLADYSPQYGCLITALAEAQRKFGPAFGGTEPGLFLSANFKPGSPPYTYPESLPIVNASGGPNCRGLPDLPSKQGSGSWYRAPFLVTDNAYIPYEPNTELQFDAPNTLQFLFNGAYAERDDF